MTTRRYTTNPGPKSKHIGSLRQIIRAWELTFDAHFATAGPTSYGDAAEQVCAKLGEDAGLAFIQAQPNTSDRTPHESLHAYQMSHALAQENAHIASVWGRENIKRAEALAELEGSPEGRELLARYVTGI